MIDANILIDLHNGGILQQLFGLTLEILTPDAVLDELIEPDRQTLRAMGLAVVGLSPAQLIEATHMVAEDARLSMGDCAVFVVARDGEMLLLTGDRRLADRAREVAIETHGVLWVLDQLESAGHLRLVELAASLRKMLDEGARLPADECERRLLRWARET